MVVYHTTLRPLRRGGIAQMTVLFRKARQRRCYFCRQVGASEAYYSDICVRHQIRISLRLFMLLARQGRFGRVWRMMGWWS